MSDLPATRRYNEKEVSRLLRRAAQLQRAAPSVPNPTGLTLAELEEIAGEAGLDVTLLRRAAAELDAGSAGSPSSFGARLAGAPTRLLLERILPFEVPDEAFAELVPLIQSGAGAPGTASQVGRTLSWASQGQTAPGSFQILVSVRKGETLIRLEERFSNLAGILFGAGSGVGAGIGVGVGGALASAAGGGALFVALPIAAVSAIFLAARTAFRFVVTRRKRTLGELMDRIVDALLQHAPRP